MEIKAATIAQSQASASSNAITISAPARQAVSSISQSQALPPATKSTLITTVATIDKSSASAPVRAEAIKAVVDLGIFLEEGGVSYPKWEVMTGLRYFAGVSPNGPALPEGVTFEDIVAKTVTQVSQELAKQPIQQVQAKVAVRQAQAAAPPPPPAPPKAPPAPAQPVKTVDETVSKAPPPPKTLEFA